MKAVTIKHKSTGNIYNAEMYTSFVYLIDEVRKITIDEFNDFFEIVK